MKRLWTVLLGSGETPLTEAKQRARKSLLSRKRLFKSLLLLALTLFVGYFLSPRILFDAEEYEEGDVIRQTIVIEEDLLLPDQVSTKLKADQLLKEQGLVFDFDASLVENTRVRIHQAFEGSRQKFAQIEEQRRMIKEGERLQGLSYFKAVRDRQMLAKRIQVYREYLASLTERQGEFKGKENLPAKEQLRKNKIDHDLTVTKALIRDLKEQDKLLGKEAEGIKGKLAGQLDQDEEAAKALAEQEKEVIQAFLESFRLPMSLEEIQKLGFAFYDERIEEELVRLMNLMLSMRVINSKQSWQLDKNQNFSLRNILSGQSSKHTDLNGFLDLAEAQAELAEKVKPLFSEDETGKRRNYLLNVARQLVQPTITENKLEREKRKEDLLGQMNPVYFSVKKGEIIARAGDRATSHQAQLIEAYFQELSKGANWPKLIGVHLFVMLSLVLIYFSFQRSYRRLGVKHLSIIALSIALTLLMAKGILVLGEMLEMRYIDFQAGLFRFLIPVALGSMLVGILIGFPAAVITGILNATFVTLMAQGDVYFLVYCLLASLVAAMPLTRFVSRFSLVLHGLRIAGVSMPLALLILVVEPSATSVPFLSNLVAAAIGGMTAAMLVSLLLPFYESIFDVTTNLKLLELSNLNHPALRELIQNASGTFHHSVIVGNLAEAGAGRIGANPLLARVGAYYHDIGKGLSPLYFYENKPPSMRNLHDDMAPHESARRIIEHITKGAELAERYRLGKAIKDILVQHHGDAPVRYFLAKARQLAQEQGTGETIDEADYRYPGPKPQSLEAALVMLADMAEAATRSIEKPTEEAIRQMVTKLTWKCLEEGQLDESGLTLKMIRLVIDQYVQVLGSIHHNRIAYPEEQKPKELELEGQRPTDNLYV